MILIIDMKIKSVLSTLSFGLCLCNISSAQVIIDLDFVDVGNDGVNGSGYTIAEADRIVELVNRWEERLIDYRDDTNAPTSISIDIAAIDVDGVGGTLGFAGPQSSVQTGAFTVVETGTVRFDIADIAVLSANDFDLVVEHEVGHVLGIGTLWNVNNVYVDGTGEYTGEAGLAAYQRDVDPDATFIPIFANNGLPGSDDAHFDEDGSIFITNPEVSYFGESLEDELLTPFLTGSGYVADFDLGTLYDIGYIVNYELGRELFWDGSATTANGTIDSGAGTWNAANNNWTIENGDINSEFVSRAAVHFQGTGSAVTIDGTVNPFETIFNSTGFSLNGGAIDVTEFDSTLTVTNAGDIATLNTSVFGTGSLIIDGNGTVVNTGLISSDIDIETAATLESDANTLGNNIEINNGGTFTLNGDNTIATYTSNGGTLQGDSILTAASYNLSNNALLLSETGSGTLNLLAGNIDLGAASAADAVVIQDGASLTTNGDLLTATPSVINSGDLIINGDLSVGDYVGTGRGSLQGVGELSVTSLTGGSIETTAVSDGLLDLTVNANGGIVDLGPTSTLTFDLDSTVVLSGLTAFPLINNASEIISGFGSFNSTALGDEFAGIFDTSSGILYILPNGSTSSGTTPNERSVSTNLFGSTLGADSNFGNAQLTPQSLSIIELASLRQSTLAGVTIDTELQEISPEAYGSVTEYGVQSYRQFLNILVNGRNAIINSDSTVYAGINGFSIESDSSIDNSDFELQGSGGYIGVERSVNDYTRWGFILGLDSADISGERISLDGDGVLASVYVEHSLPMPFNDGMKPGTIRASAGFSQYSFDGTRTAQGLVNRATDIDNTVLHLGVNYKSQIHTGKSGHISLFTGINYVKSTTDSFSETGSINSLDIDEIEKDATFLELGIEGTLKSQGSPWALQGSLRAIYNLGDDGTDITSSFADASSLFDVTSPGFSETSYQANIGIFYDLNSKSTLNLSGFSSFGDDFDSSAGGNLGISYTW